MKIVCLSSFVNHARHRKRINAFHGLGADVTLIGFEREFYPAKTLQGRFVSLGKIQHGNYISRLKYIFSAVPKVRSGIKGADILYVFDFDMLLFGLLASAGLKVRIIYEIGDVHNVFLANGFVPVVLRHIEKKVMRCIDLLVVTSKAYITGYYKGILGITSLNYFVLENKVDASQVRHVTEPHEFNKKPLVIGYFGGLQCAASWAALKQVVKQSNGNIRLYVRGLSYAFQKELEQDAGLVEGIDYGGPYVNPDELPEIYSRVDVVWVAHHHAEANILWARANRFYESCYFKKPMIAQQNTEDGRIVEDLKIGLCVDLKNISASVENILSITQDNIGTWYENIISLPETLYTYSDEYQHLFNKAGLEMPER